MKDKWKEMNDGFIEKESTYHETTPWPDCTILSEYGLVRDAPIVRDSNIVRYFNIRVRVRVRVRVGVGIRDRIRALCGRTEGPDEMERLLLTSGYGNGRSSCMVCKGFEEVRCAASRHGAKKNCRMSDTDRHLVEKIHLLLRRFCQKLGFGWMRKTRVLFCFVFFFLVFF